MAEQPPLDKLPDPAAFGAPTNDPPAPFAPDATPADPDRPVVVTDGATHVVVADSLGGGFVRGDKVHERDLPKGASVDRLVNLKPFPALRPLTAEESKGVPKAKALKSVSAADDTDPDDPFGDDPDDPDRKSKGKKGHKSLTEPPK